MSAPLTKRERKLKRKLKKVIAAETVTSAPMFRQGDLIYIPGQDTYLQVMAVRTGTELARYRNPMRSGVVTQRRQKAR